MLRKNKTISTFLLLLLTTLLLSNCISTTIKGFTDSNYPYFKIRKVIVRAPNANFNFAGMIEDSMVKALIDSGVKSESFLRRFPPTRDWNNENVANDLMAQGFDSIMYVALTNDNSSVTTGSYITTGQANAYGGYTSVSTPTTKINRRTETRITLYNVINADKIWIGDSITNSQGLLFVQDEAQAADIASSTVEALKNSSLL